ncbi:MAG: 1-acyl-sn-glycerol-3-phosphate acyltransferase [Chitinispirillaceae bacterium]|nr:1-acyl-sn-glycerol-3-phosphate acyltransferase [Chitinispirillaceae bacterium]
MDRKNSGLIRRIPHSLFLLLWLVFSVILYGSICSVAGLFSRRIAQFIGRLWSRHLLFFAGIRVGVQGVEKLAGGECYVFFANHQSALDIPILYAGIAHPLVFIAKRELFWIPIMGFGMHGMGHIPLDRSNPRKARAALSHAVKRLRKNRLSFVMFPEGTRSYDGTLGNFKQGSFTLALEACVRIVPVAIKKANERLQKKSLVVRPGPVELVVCDPVDPQGMEKGDLMQTVRSAIERVMAPSGQNAQIIQ